MDMGLKNRRFSRYDGGSQYGRSASKKPDKLRYKAKVQRKTVRIQLEYSSNTVKKDS